MDCQNSEVTLQNACIFKRRQQAISIKTSLKTALPASQSTYQSLGYQVVLCKLK